MGTAPTSSGPGSSRPRTIGASWTRISDGLPAGNPIYVVREDPKNPDLLYAGSEFAAFVSVDGGWSWDRLGRAFPRWGSTTSSSIPGKETSSPPPTAGASGSWTTSRALQQLTPEVRASDLHLFDQKVATKWQGISRGATRGHMLFMGRNPLTIDQQEPGNSPSELQNSAAIHFWLGSAPSGSVTVEISSLDGSILGEPGGPGSRRGEPMVLGSSSFRGDGPQPGMGEMQARAGVGMQTPDAGPRPRPGATWFGSPPMGKRWKEPWWSGTTPASTRFSQP